MNPGLVVLISIFCTNLYGPDVPEKRNYNTFACTDQIIICVEKTKNDPGVCIAKYVKKNYRKRR